MSAKLQQSGMSSRFFNAGIAKREYGKIIDFFTFALLKYALFALYFW